MILVVDFEEILYFQSNILLRILVRMYPSAPVVSVEGMVFYIQIQALNISPVRNLTSVWEMLKSEERGWFTYIENTGYRTLKIQNFQSMLIYQAL